LISEKLTVNDAIFNFYLLRKTVLFKAKKTPPCFLAFLSTALSLLVFCLPFKK